MFGIVCVEIFADVPEKRGNIFRVRSAITQYGSALWVSRGVLRILLGRSPIEPQGAGPLRIGTNNTTCRVHGWPFLGPDIYEVI